MLLYNKSVNYCGPTLPSIDELPYIIFGRSIAIDSKGPSLLLAKASLQSINQGGSTPKDSIKYQ